MTAKIGELYAMGWIARESPDGARSVTALDGTVVASFRADVGVAFSANGLAVLPPAVVQWLVRASE